MHAMQDPLVYICDGAANPSEALFTGPSLQGTTTAGVIVSVPLFLLPSASLVNMVALTSCYFPNENSFIFRYLFIALLPRPTLVLRNIASAGGGGGAVPAPGLSVYP